MLLKHYQISTYFSCGCMMVAVLCDDVSRGMPFHYWQWRSAANENSAQPPAAGISTNYIENQHWHTFSIKSLYSTSKWFSL